MFFIVFLFVFIYFLQIPANNAHCVDIHHHIVSQGLHYVPGPNPCTLCICEKGTPKWCKQVLCSPPQNCKSFEVGNSCCEFKCLDDILSKSDNYSETYDLALRLIASAVTAVLSLSLLFFLIHRLRQRKIRLRRQNRQLSEDQRSLNSIGYITGSIGYLPGSIGYLGSASNEIEFHYEECNVQYPLWKPPGNYFPRGEAPPPYEEAVRASRTEAEMVNNQQHNHNHNHNHVGQMNTAPFTYPTNRNENVSLTLVHNTHVSITPSVQQNGVASSQCNVMLHQSNNVQSVQADVTSGNNNGNAGATRADTPADTHAHTHTQQNTSVSLACGNSGASHDYVIDSTSSSSFLPTATLESQVDVHYENYNHSPAVSAPVVTVSVKNEESFPKQTLSVDYLRDRVDRGTYATVEGKQLAAKNESISCSSSWRREAVQHTTSTSINGSGSKFVSSDHKQKLIDKNKNTKIIDSTGNTSTPTSSKSYRSENPHIDPKFKKCNMIKELPRSSKIMSNRIYEKQYIQDIEDHNLIIEAGSHVLATSDFYYLSSKAKRSPDHTFRNALVTHSTSLLPKSSKSDNRVQKSYNNDMHKDILVQELNKHRTIPQKFSKTLDSESCYVNTSDFGKRKDDDFSEHCDMILKQHNIDKIRYAAEKLDKKNSEKSLNASIRNSLCAPAELRNVQRNNGLLKGEVSSHRTLPKNLRELSEAFYFNFDNSVCEDINLDYLMKKTLPRNSGLQNEVPHSSTVAEKIVKSSDIGISNTNTIGRKHPIQKSNNSANSISSNINSCCRNSLPISCQIPNPTSNPPELSKNFIEKSDVVLEPLELDRERERSCVSYRCASPLQDDVDDYRSECENCKSLSFEDCNEEEGDLLNETMTLQRRPMEQGEEHLFYRTSLTLPSHTKRTTRSVPLNIQRESWFMAMQELTSSSESD